MTNQNPSGNEQPSRGGKEPAPNNERDGGGRENRDNRGNRILESD